MRALLLVSHGSRHPEARKEIEALAATLKQKSGAPIVQCAFLDVELPRIGDGIEECVRFGATEIVVLMNFMNSGNHVVKDVPAIVKDAQAKHPEVAVRMTPHVGSHPKIADLFLDFIR